MLARSLLLGNMCTALLAFRCVPYTVFPAYRRATRRMQLSLFATAPEDDDEDMMANACLPWTKEDDEMLQRESNKGASLEDLSAALRRGPQGVKRRLKDISNPDHAAYARLHNLPFTEKLSTFRPCGDCIERILWDPSLDDEDFFFVYRDRFNGMNEAPFNAANLNVKGKERKLVKSIPEHRILHIRYKQRIVWDKSQKLDYIFGSHGSPLTLEEVMLTYDDWIEEQRNLSQARSESIQIYCVPDGLFFDFNAGVKKLFKKHASQVAPKVLWPKLASSPNFYSDLPWTDDGRQLWDVVRIHNTTIVTTAAGGEWAKDQKDVWCARELGADVAVLSCPQNKIASNYCAGPSAVLISSKDAARAAWEAEGGTFIQHKSLTQTIDELSRLGVVISVALSPAASESDAELDVFEYPE